MPEAPVAPAAPLFGLFQATLATCVAAATLGVVYGFLLAWVPHLYLLTPIAAGVFGYLVARVAEQVLVAGRLKDRRAALWLPIGAGVVGFYVAWVAWIATYYYDRQAFNLVWYPWAMVEQMRVLIYFPNWSLLGWRQSVFDMVSLWATEMIVFFASVHASAVGVQRRIAGP